MLFSWKVGLIFYVSVKRNATPMSVAAKTTEQLVRRRAKRISHYAKFMQETLQEANEKMHCDGRLPQYNTIIVNNVMFTYLFMKNTK